MPSSRSEPLTVQIAVKLVRESNCMYFLLLLPSTSTTTQTGCMILQYLMSVDAGEIVEVRFVRDAAVTD